MVEIEFNQESHQYWLDGQLAPSVTQVLSPLARFEHVPPDVLRAAADFGTNVHIACDLYDKGILDEESLDPALAPYLNNAWKKFLRESGFTILESERRVGSVRLGVAGTLDKLARNPSGKKGILDIKSGVYIPVSVGAQTMGYSLLHGDMTGEHCLRRWCLQLRADGYRLHELHDPADFTVFRSCLIVHRDPDNKVARTNIEKLMSRGRVH